jgi:hypothetical protein
MLIVFVGLKNAGAAIYLVDYIRFYSFINEFCTSASNLVPFLMQA